MNKLVIDDIQFNYSASTEYKVNKTLHRICQILCNTLNISCPDIIICDHIQPNFNALSNVVTFTSRDISVLKDSIIFVSKKLLNNEKITVGLLAHEIRHLYQSHYPYKFTITPFYSSYDHFIDEREIDADAFAIYIISEIYHISLRKAGSIFCNNLKNTSKKTYILRIQKAKEISKNIGNII